MRRTEQAQGLRLMKFEEVYGRTVRGVLGQAEAAEILGISQRILFVRRAKRRRALLLLFEEDLCHPLDQVANLLFVADALLTQLAGGRVNFLASLELRPLDFDQKELPAERRLLDRRSCSVRCPIAHRRSLGGRPQFLLYAGHVGLLVGKGS